MTDTPLPLLMFAPCERVIIGGEGDNTASLIAILQGFEVDESELTSQLSQVSEHKDEKAPVPVLPMTWFVFSLWENDYSGRRFKQRFEIRSPNGKTMIGGDADINLRPDTRFHRVTGKLPGFPISGLGDYMLVLLLKTDDGEFVERMRFPIPITPRKPNETNA
jgi:hypothetical protein